MKLFSLCIVFLICKTASAKIKIDEDLIKNKSRKVAQYDLINKAQEKLKAFIKCSNQIKSTNSIDAEAAKCVQEQFYSILSPVSIIAYLNWLNSNIQISNLFNCEGELLSLAQEFKEKPKDLFYCFAVKAETTQQGFISFRVKDEELKILKIKL